LTLAFLKRRISGSMSFLRTGVLRTLMVVKFRVMRSRTRLAFLQPVQNRS